MKLLDPPSTGFLFDRQKNKTCSNLLWWRVDGNVTLRWEIKHFFFLNAAIHWFFLSSDKCAAPNQLSGNMMDSLVKKSIRVPTDGRGGDGRRCPVQCFMTNLGGWVGRVMRTILYGLILSQLNWFLYYWIISMENLLTDFTLKNLHELRNSFEFLHLPINNLFFINWRMNVNWVFVEVVFGRDIEGCHVIDYVKRWECVAMTACITLQIKAFFSPHRAAAVPSDLCQ